MKIVFWKDETSLVAFRSFKAQGIWGDPGELQVWVSILLVRKAVIVESNVFYSSRNKRLSRTCLHRHIEHASQLAKQIKQNQVSKNDVLYSSTPCDWWDLMKSGSNRSGALRTLFFTVLVRAKACMEWCLNDVATSLLRLSGMPECKFGMNDKLIMPFAQRENTYVWIAFMVFHVICLCWFLICTILYHFATSDLRTCIDIYIYIYCYIDTYMRTISYDILPYHNPLPYPTIILP